MTGALPRDPALPQLATALDADAMAAVFDRALRGQRDVRVLGCRIDRIKYRPRRNCSVSYVLRLRDGRRVGPYEQRVAARFCSAGDAARRHAKALGRACLPSLAGPALLHWPALDMSAHWLPNDARLDSLALLQDDAALRTRCLPELVAALGGSDAHLVGHRTRLVQYVPEHRVCGRVTLALRSAPQAPVTTCTLYVKASVDRCGQHTHAVLQSLHADPAQRRGELRTPRPVLWQEAFGLHWQLALPGRALRDVDPQLGCALSERLGAQLALLHATPLPLLPARSVDDVRRQPQEVAALLAQAEPAWQHRLAALARMLADGGEALDCESPATLHGDLHPRNILVHGARLGFVDLDDVQRAPAVLELAAWIGGALYRAALDGVAARTSVASCQAFLAGYAARGGRVADEPLLAWCVAHDLLCRRAYRCVASLKPGRYALVPRLLDLAHAIARGRTFQRALQCSAEAA